jgi:hypothetical protein
MPDDVAIETKELQEAIDELHQERQTRESEEKSGGWVKYIGLSTAILAVFAAVGALQSGSLINEALINQVKASDTWNEYQSSKEKQHTYTIAVNALLDAAPIPTPTGTGKGKWTPEPSHQRIREYENEVAKEQTKSEELGKKAKELEKEVQSQIPRHHRYAYSVALIQIAIALGAIAALARVKSVWFISLAAGAIGIALFLAGFIA